MSFVGGRLKFKDGGFMNYSSQIFKMLGVEPNETFKLKNKTGLYKISQGLTLMVEDEFGHWNSTEDLQYILIGTWVIIKTLTREEQVAVDYARLCGCKWLAKDSRGDIYAYNTKPYKDCGIWNGKRDDNPNYMKIRIPLPFLSTDEPYYIGD